MKGGDHQSGWLFEKPKPGEKGYLKPGFHPNEKGQIVDEKGNVYDEAYDLVKEGPSEGLLKAREQHPDWSDPELTELARIYQAQIDREKKIKEEREKRGKELRKQ